MRITAIDTQAEAERIVAEVINRPFLSEDDTLMRLGTHQQGIIFIVHDLVLRIIQLVQEQNPAEALTLDVVREGLKNEVNTSDINFVHLTVAQLKKHVANYIDTLMNEREARL